MNAIPQILARARRRTTTKLVVIFGASVTAWMLVALLVSCLIAPALAYGLVMGLCISLCITVLAACCLGAPQDGGRP
jgi:hypothetical protein